jgi:hypothetical protein
MNGRLKMQGGKNWIFPKEMIANPVLLGLSLAGNLFKPLLSFYGTEWRERGYGLGRLKMQGRKNWILPKEMNANRFFWDSHWLEILSNHYFSLWDRIEGSWLWTRLSKQQTSRRSDAASFSRAMIG